MWGQLVLFVGALDAPDTNALISSLKEVAGTQRLLCLLSLSIAVAVHRLTDCVVLAVKWLVAVAVNGLVVARVKGLGPA